MSKYTNLGNQSIAKICKSCQSKYCHNMKFKSWEKSYHPKYCPNMQILKTKVLPKIVNLANEKTRKSFYYVHVHHCTTMLTYTAQRICSVHCTLVNWKLLSIIFSLKIKRKLKALKALQFGILGKFKFFFKKTVLEFNEFKPLLKSPKNRFQLSAGLNL